MCAPESHYNSRERAPDRRLLNETKRKPEEKERERERIEPNRESNKRTTDLPFCLNTHTHTYHITVISRQYTHTIQYNSRKRPMMMTAAVFFFFFFFFGLYFTH